MILSSIQKFFLLTIVLTERTETYNYGSGVFILVKNNIPSSQVNYDSSNELIWVHIHNNTDADIILGSFYCPPPSPVEILDELAGSLSHIQTIYPSA